MQLFIIFLLTPKIFWVILILENMRYKSFPIFTNIYNPSFSLSLAEKKHKRNDILLFYENQDNKFVYSCSKSLSYYGIKPGLSINFVKKITDNFFLLPCNDFIKEKDNFKKILINELKNYAFEVYDIPFFTTNSLSFDSFSLIADFSGCQLVYKPIFVFLDSIFKSLLKIDRKLYLSFFTSNSFSFSLFVPTGLNINPNKNTYFTFFNSNQFFNFINLSNILSPLKFCEESGIFWFSDFAKIPLDFQDKLLNLAILSSPLSLRIKLANRLKPLTAIFQSSIKKEALDIFIFSLIKKLFGKNHNSTYEIVLTFSPPTNNKDLIYTKIREKLYLESFFFKNYWIKSKSPQISVIVEYTNQFLDKFNLFYDNHNILSFLYSIAQDIVIKLKGKSAISSIILEFDKTSCEALFNDYDKDFDEKLLNLFYNLIQKFGDEKIHLAG